MLSKIGVNGGAVGQPYVSTPYSGHAPVQVRNKACHLMFPKFLTFQRTAQWVIDHFFTNSWWLEYNRKLHIDIRRRAIRKREREAAKAQKTE